VKAYRALADFKAESAFETWLTRIAINAVRDVARRRKPVVLFSELHGDGGDDAAELPASLDPPTAPLPSATSCRGRSAGGSPTRSSGSRRGSGPSS